MTTAQDEPRLWDAGKAPVPPARRFLRRALELRVRDETVRVVLDIPARPLRLAEVAPLVWSLDDRILAVYLRGARRAGREVFCRRGCRACCGRFLVVLAPAEMYATLELLEGFPPARRRAVRAWMDGAFERARQEGLIERLRSLGGGTDPLDVIERWWRGQPATACPFLDGEAGTCGIYPRRFVACREYYSMLPPAHCARRATARLPIGLSLMNVLWQLEQELTGEPTGAVSLPFVSMWAEVLAARARRVWPGEQVVEVLAGILERAAAEAGRLSAGADAGSGPA